MPVGGVNRPKKTPFEGLAPKKTKIVEPPASQIAKPNMPVGPGMALPAPKGTTVSKTPVTPSQALMTLIDGAFAAKTGTTLPKGSFTPMMIGPGARPYIKDQGIQAVALKPKKGGKK